MASASLLSKRCSCLKAAIEAVKTSCELWGEATPPDPDADDVLLCAEKNRFEARLSIALQSDKKHPMIKDLVNVELSKIQKHRTLSLKDVAKPLVKKCKKTTVT
jgi:hypothetical protein